MKRAPSNLRHTDRPARSVYLALVLPVVAGAVAQLSLAAPIDVSWIGPNLALSAAKLKANLQELQDQATAVDGRVTALEQSETYFAESDAVQSVIASVAQPSVEVPGTGKAIVTSAPTTLNVFATGTLSGIGASSAYCAVYAILDGAPMSAFATAAVTQNGVGAFGSFAFQNQVALPAGNHTLALRVQRRVDSSGDCILGGGQNSAQWTATVR